MKFRKAVICSAKLGFRGNWPFILKGNKGLYSEMADRISLEKRDYSNGYPGVHCAALVPLVGYCLFLCRSVAPAQLYSRFDPDAFFQKCTTLCKRAVQAIMQQRLFLQTREMLATKWRRKIWYKEILLSTSDYSGFKWRTRWPWKPFETYCSSYMSSTDTISTNNKLFFWVHKWWPAGLV